jgi:hypothetical protein
VSYDEGGLFFLLVLVELMTITVQTFFFVFSEIRGEVIVCFVDVGGTDDYHCLSFLFCVQ